MRKMTHTFTVLAIMAALFVTAVHAYAIVPGSVQSSQNKALAVQNTKGESIGTVTNALEDSSGNILFVIVSVGKNNDQENKEVVVPLGAFSYDHDRSAFVLDISREDLAKAPEFKESDLGDPAFAQRVYRYYAEAPAWTK